MLTAQQRRLLTLEIPALMDTVLKETPNLSGFVSVQLFPKFQVLSNTLVYAERLDQTDQLRRNLIAKLRTVWQEHGKNIVGKTQARSKARTAKPSTPLNEAQVVWAGSAQYQSR
jgi:hypothetical protein